MTATITNMELVHADDLTPDQLMVDDLILFGDSLVQVISVESDGTGDIYSVKYLDEYGDKDTVEFSYTDTVKLFVYLERE